MLFRSGAVANCGELRRHSKKFVLACLAHPKEDEFLAMAAQFPAVRDRAAVAIAALYKAKIKGDAGKY